MHRRPLAIAVLLALGVVLPGARTTPALACSGPMPPAIESLVTASAVALVRVDEVAGPNDLPTYRLAVEEAFKGSFPPVVAIEAPAYHACGDRIRAQPGDRLLIAFDARPFSASAERFAPYWRVDPAGRLRPEGIDDAALGWTTVDEARAGMAAEFGDAGTIESEGQPDAGGPLGVPIIVLVALAVLAGSGLLFAGAWLLARRPPAGPPGARR